MKLDRLVFFDGLDEAQRGLGDDLLVVGEDGAADARRDVVVVARAPSDLVELDVNVLDGPADDVDPLDVLNVLVLRGELDAVSAELADALPLQILEGPPGLVFVPLDRLLVLAVRALQPALEGKKREQTEFPIACLSRPALMKWLLMLRTVSRTYFHFVTSWSSPV